MNKSLADILRDYRLHTGLTQKALAEKLAVDVHTVAKWETGKSLPRAEHLINLLNWCGVPCGCPKKP